jgi:hypothetical protein
VPTIMSPRRRPFKAVFSYGPQGTGSPARDQRILGPTRGLARWATVSAGVSSGRAGRDRCCSTKPSVSGRRFEPPLTARSERIAAASGTTPLYRPRSGGADRVGRRPLPHQRRQAPATADSTAPRPQSATNSAWSDDRAGSLDLTNADEAAERARELIAPLVSVRPRVAILPARQRPHTKRIVYSRARASTCQLGICPSVAAPAKGHLPFPASSRASPSAAKAAYFRA